MAEAQIKRRESDKSESEDPMPKCEFTVPDLDDTEGDEIIFLGGVTLSNKELLAFVENTVTTCCHLVSKLTGKTLPVHDFVPTAKKIDPDKMRLFFVSDGECSGPTFKYRGQYLFVKNDLHSLIMPVGAEPKIVPVSEKTAPVSEKTAPVSEKTAPDLEPVLESPGKIFSDEDMTPSKVVSPTELFGDEEMQSIVSLPEVEVEGQGQDVADSDDEEEDEESQSEVAQGQSQAESDSEEEEEEEESDEEVAPPVGIGPSKRPIKSPRRYGSSADENYLDSEAELSETESETEAPQDSDLDPEYVPSPVGFRKLAQIRTAGCVESSESELEEPQGSDVDPDYIPSGAEDWDDEEIIEDDVAAKKAKKKKKNASDSDNIEKTQTGRKRRKKTATASDSDFDSDEFEKLHSSSSVSEDIDSVTEHSYASPQKARPKKSSGKKSASRVREKSFVQKSASLVQKPSVSEIQDAVSKIDVVPKDTAPASKFLGAMMSALSRKQTARLSYKNVVPAGVVDPLDNQEGVTGDEVAPKVDCSTESAQSAGSMPSGDQAKSDSGPASSSDKFIALKNSDGSFLLIKQNSVSPSPLKTSAETSKEIGPVVSAAAGKGVVLIQPKAVDACVKKVVSNLKTSDSTGTGAVVSGKTNSDTVGLVGKNSVSKDSVSNDTVSKNSVSKDSVSKDSVSKNSVSKDSVSKDSVSKDSVSKNSVSKNRVSTNTVSKNTVSKDTVSKDSVSKNTVSKDSVSKDSVSKNSVSKDSVSKDSVSKNTLSFPASSSTGSAGQAKPKSQIASKKSDPQSQTAGSGEVAKPGISSAVTKSSKGGIVLAKPTNVSVSPKAGMVGCIVVKNLATGAKVTVPVDKNSAAGMGPGNVRYVQVTKASSKDASPGLPSQQGTAQNLLSKQSQKTSVNNNSTNIAAKNLGQVSVSVVKADKTQSFEESLEKVAPSMVSVEKVASSTGSVSDDDNGADLTLDYCEMDVEEMEAVETEMETPAVESERENVQAGVAESKTTAVKPKGEDVPPTSKKKTRIGPKSYLMKIDPERCRDDENVVVLSSDEDDLVNMQPMLSINKLDLGSRSVKILKRECEVDDSETTTAKKRRFLEEFEIIPIFEKIGSSGPTGTEKEKKKLPYSSKKLVNYEFPISRSSSGRAIRRPDRLEPNMLSSYTRPRSQSIGMTPVDKDDEMNKAKMASAKVKKSSSAQMKKKTSARGSGVDQKETMVEEDMESSDSEPGVESASHQAESRADAKLIARNTKEFEIAASISQIGERKISVNYVKESPEMLPRFVTLKEISSVPPDLLCSKDHAVHDTDCCCVQCGECRKLNLREEFSECNIRLGDLSAHLKTHQRDTVWFCEYAPLCHCICYTEESRQSHVEEHRCAICGIVNRSQNLVEDHKNVHVFDDKRTGYRCSKIKCRGVENNFKAMLLHIQFEHSRGVQDDDIIVCGYNGHCPYTFTEFEDFQAHFKLVHECLRCGSLFNTQMEKSKHDHECSANVETLTSGRLQSHKEPKRPSKRVLARGLRPSKTQDVTKTMNIMKPKIGKSAWELNGEIKVSGPPTTVSVADGLVILQDGTICAFRKVPEDSFGGAGIGGAPGVGEDQSAGSTPPGEDEIDGDEVNLEMNGRLYTFESLRGVLLKPLLGLAPKTSLNIVIVVDTLDMQTLKKNPKAFEITKTLGRQSKQRGVSLGSVLEKPVVDFDKDASDRWFLCTPRHFDCLFMHGFMALSLNGGRGWLTPQPNTQWVPSTAVNVAKLIQDTTPPIPSSAPTNPEYQHFLNLRNSCATVPVEVGNKTVSFKGIKFILLQPLPTFKVRPGSEAVIIVVAPTTLAEPHSDALETLFGSYANMFINFADSPAKPKPCADQQLQGKRPLFLVCPPNDFDLMFSGELFKLSAAGIWSPGQATISHAQRYAKSFVEIELKTVTNQSVSCRGLRCRLELPKFGLLPGTHIIVVVFVKEECEIQEPQNGVCLWSKFGEKLMRKFLNYSADDIALGFCKFGPYVLLCRPEDLDMLYSDGLLSLESEYPRTDIAEKQNKCVDTPEHVNAEHVKSKRAKIAHAVVNVQDLDGRISACHGIQFVFKPSGKPVCIVVVETPADVRNSVTSEVLLDIFGKDACMRFVNFSSRPIRCVVEPGNTTPHIVLGLHEFDQFYQAGKLGLPDDEAAAKVGVDSTENTAPSDPFPVLTSHLSMLPPPPYVAGTTLAKQQLERSILSHVYVPFRGSCEPCDYVHGLKFILKRPILGLLPGTEVIFLLNADMVEGAKNSVFDNLFGERGASYINPNLKIDAMLADIVFKDARYVMCNVAQFEIFYKAGCVDVPSEVSVSETGALETSQDKPSEKSTVAAGNTPSGCVLNLTCSNLMYSNLLKANLCVDIKQQAHHAAEQTVKGGGSITLEDTHLNAVRIKVELRDSDFVNTASTDLAAERLVPKNLLPALAGNSQDSVDLICEESNVPFRYTCLRKGCAYKTDEKTAFYLHVKMLHGNKPLLHVCRCCKAEFSSQEELTNHIAVHFSDAISIPAEVLKKLEVGAGGVSVTEVNICRQCGECSANRAEFFHHVTNHGHMVWPCGECGRRFSSQSELALHSQLFHDVGRQYMCEVCFMRFETFTEMFGHRTEQHMSTLNQ